MIGKDMCLKIAQHLEIWDILNLRKVNKEFYNSLNVEKRNMKASITHNKVCFTLSLNTNNKDDKIHGYIYKYNKKMYAAWKYIRSLYEYIANLCIENDKDILSENNTMYFENLKIDFDYDMKHAELMWNKGKIYLIEFSYEVDDMWNVKITKSIPPFTVIADICDIKKIEN